MTLRVVLVLPTSWSPKATVVGDRLTTEPVPERATGSGASVVSVGVIVSVPVRAPDVVGVKLTEMVHVLPPARLAPQVFAETAKSPEAAMVERNSVAPGGPPLDRTTFCEALVVATVCVAKVRLVGVTLGLGTSTVPDRVTVSTGFTGSLVVMVTAPMRGWFSPDGGRKVTPKVHAPPPATEAPVHVSPEIV